MPAISKKQKQERQNKILELIRSGKYFADKSGNIYRENSSKVAVHIKNKGYKVACLRLPELTYVTVHQFMMLYFNGSYDVDLTINHKNGIKHDNEIENLELVTQKENSIHAFRNGLARAKKGQDHPNTTLTDSIVLEIYNKKNSYSGVELSKMYNISRSTISRIVLKRSWRHLLNS